MARRQPRNRHTCKQAATHTHERRPFNSLSSRAELSHAALIKCVERGTKIVKGAPVESVGFRRSSVVRVGDKGARAAGAHCCIVSAPSSVGERRVRYRLKFGGVSLLTSDTTHLSS